MYSVRPEGTRFFRSQSEKTNSHHLKLLRDAGLIDCERHGLWAYYFVNRAALAALRARITAPLDALA